MVVMPSVRQWGPRYTLHSADHDVLLASVTQSSSVETGIVIAGSFNGITVSSLTVNGKCR